MTMAPFSRTPRGTWTPQPRLIGVALPFVVALVCSYIDLSILLLVWLPFLLGVAAAAILRSWWALLAIPLALVVGTLLGIAPHGLHPTHPGFIAGTALFVFLTLVEVTIGAAIGVPLGHELEKLVPSNR
jgi:ABC-type xylose transport system permease subunit